MSTPTPRTDAAWASSFEPCEYRAAHTARTMRDECAKLECELATAKAILASIEEDGTEEHNAAVRLRQELAAERARLDAMVANCWVVHSEVGGSFSVFSNTCGDYIATAQTYRAAIDAAMKEGTK